MCLLRVCLELVFNFLCLRHFLFFVPASLVFCVFRRTRWQTFIIKTFRLQFECLKTKKQKEMKKGKHKMNNFRRYELFCEICVRCFSPREPTYFTIWQPKFIHISNFLGLTTSCNRWQKKKYVYAIQPIYG